MQVTGYSSNEKLKISDVSEASVIEKQMIVFSRTEDGKLNGRILDGDTKEPLAGANVILADTNVGTSTNSNGEFILDLGSNKSYKVIVSYVGYQQASLSVSH